MKMLVRTDFIKILVFSFNIIDFISKPDGQTTSLFMLCWELAHTESLKYSNWSEKNTHPQKQNPMKYHKDGMFLWLFGYKY